MRSGRAESPSRADHDADRRRFPARSTSPCAGGLRSLIRGCGPAKSYPASAPATKTSTSWSSARRPRISMRASSTRSAPTRRASSPNGFASTAAPSATRRGSRSSRSQSSAQRRITPEFIAFDYARRLGRRKVTTVHKANIMKFTDGLWLQISREVAEKHSDIEFEDRIVDDALPAGSCSGRGVRASSLSTSLPGLYPDDPFSDLSGGPDRRARARAGGMLIGTGRPPSSSPRTALAFSGEIRRPEQDEPDGDAAVGGDDAPAISRKWTQRIGWSRRHCSNVEDAASRYDRLRPRRPTAVRRPNGGRHERGRRMR